ncbi:MAG: aminotransferase class V-fold PLP-dependent enzyme [Blastocatellia bacterium]
MNTDAPSISRREFLRSSSMAAALAGRDAEELFPVEWTSFDRATDEEMFWRMVRRQFFIEEGLIYLNAGMNGPTLRAAYDGACRNLFEMGTNYNKAFRANMMGEAVPKFIGRVAEFVGATPDEVAFTSGTTEAMNYIANGLDLAPGDEVLTTTHEHLGGIYPWLLKAKRHGIVVRQIEVKSPPASEDELLEQFARALTPRTKVLSFCHIHYTDGAMLPVRRLCELARRRGILSVVDGAQSIGMIDFRISDLGCDFYAASFHKWLCAPYGCGLLYVREEMRDRLWPTVVLSFSGWDRRDRDGREAGVTDITYASNYPKALLKYSSNIEYYGSLWWTVALAMDFQNLVGRKRIEARIRTLAERALNGLRQAAGVRLFSSENSALRTGLVSFRIPKVKTSDLYYQMRDQARIIGRYIQHPGINFDVNRFSPHIFNSPEEIDTAIDVVKAKAAGG